MLRNLKVGVKKSGIYQTIQYTGAYSGCVKVERRIFTDQLPTMKHQRVFSILILLSFALASCATRKNYPSTTFLLSNNSSKRVNFTVTVDVLTSFGLQPLTQPFSANPGDTVLVRKVHFRAGANPAEAFNSFILFPVEGLVFQDPKVQANWMLTFDKKGNPQYLFDVIQQH